MNAPKIGRTPVLRENAMSPHDVYRWDGQPARIPEAGEYFLSGAIPTAYKAGEGMTNAYFIAVPVHETVTPRTLLSDALSLTVLVRFIPAQVPTGRLRMIAKRARQLADDADALAKHLDSESLKRLLDNSETQA